MSGPKFEIQKKIEILNSGHKTKEMSAQCKVSISYVEVSNVKELRYIDPYSKVTTNRSLIVVPFENLIELIGVGSKLAMKDGIPSYQNQRTRVFHKY